MGAKPAKVAPDAENAEDADALADGEALRIVQRGAATDEAKRLGHARRTYAAVRAGMPILLALLVFRIKLQSESKYGEVEYGFADGAKELDPDWTGRLKRTFCEVYPCWRPPGGGLLTQPGGSLCVFLLAAVYAAFAAHLRPWRRISRGCSRPSSTCRTR